MIHEDMIQKLYIEYEENGICEITITLTGLVQYGIRYNRVIR